MSNGAAQWRNGQKKLAVEVNLLRHIQRIHEEKDVLRQELQKEKRTVKLMRQTNAELRRPQSSMSTRMSEYEREGMFWLLTNGAVERGELEAEIEFQKMKVGQLEAEVEFWKAKVSKPSSRFNALATEDNDKATEKANAELNFACAICFENREMDTLRILTPCGHGFCSGCVNAHMKAVDARGRGQDCPICRGPITKVITARF